jgi:hypothetical protein
LAAPSSEGARADRSRLLRHILCLLFLPPLGIFLVIQDKALTKATKIRLVVYTLGGAFAVCLTLTLIQMQLLTRNLASMGLDF